MYKTSIPLDIDSPPKNLPLESYKSKYQPISTLGNGSFGTVDLVKFKFHKFHLLKYHDDKKGTLLYPLEDSKYNLSNLVAIKTMKKRLPLLHDYKNVKEVKFILSVQSHPCLVQIYEMFIDDVRYQLHISMEALNQNLYQLIRSRRNIQFSSPTLKSILSQLLCGIKHIHKFNYFHRDIKPENILIISTQQFYGSKEGIPPYRKNDNFIVKLADYGLARHVTNLKPYTAYVSTRWYRSPEILLRQKSYSQPLDIWAFGAVAAEIANFTPLFPGSNELEQIWKILRVLGSPLVPETSNNKYVIPLGGYWKDAQMLAHNLGFVFPEETGLTIDEVIHNPNLGQLAEVIQSCLLWDPNLRPTAVEVSRMAYFKESVSLLDRYFDNDIPIQVTLNKFSGIPSNPGVSSNYTTAFNDMTTDTVGSSTKKILTPTQTKRSSNRKNVIHSDCDFTKFYDDPNATGEENYFSGYVAESDKIQPSSGNTNDIYNICHAWMNKENKVNISSPASDKEPRIEYKTSVVPNKPSFTRFSLESEEVMNL
ncbi:uncharacterized protein SPAPADRAFT_49385 [Spathaspora passalidarum NRRL Y-27907]|uniref:Protein kinase domain-containing protein n=1 Tax=Spathaspora passalidarum (strain NRRL Y-27907 / 11-Y1) TaxID=619300 RepID=G3AI19_SPAPN|nr:uncharacterized protein SPAPADRAFT_49385 [Spathaspora passalidarum NRRL Y-27907]EGW34333.1 hypothetical protein SPAPADRAFT_49385 [Spathaspora passalidarum NRRL Y-27907]